MLNKTHFITLAGNPAKWDAELAATENLCKTQESQGTRGYLPAELVQTAYGWSVRYGSGLQGFGLLISGKGKTKQQVIQEGIGWAEKDPDHREFYARKTDVLITEEMK